MNPGSRLDVFPLPPQAHLCGTFQTPGERNRAMGAFFRTGLGAGEHCMIAVDTADPDDILAAIGSPAEVTAWKMSGRLTVRTAPEPRQQPRRPLTFDEMMDVWGELIDRSRFTPVRLGGEASWWLHQTSQEQLLLYESAMSRTIPAEVAVLCLYDLNRFSSGVLIDVVQTHPRALVSEMIIENPYYIEPEAYLALRDRRRRGLPGIPTAAEATAFLDSR